MFRFCFFSAYCLWTHSECKRARNATNCFSRSIPIFFFCLSSQPMEQNPEEDPMNEVGMRNRKENSHRIICGSIVCILSAERLMMISSANVFIRYYDVCVASCVHTKCLRTSASKYGVPRIYRFGDSALLVCVCTRERIQETKFGSWCLCIVQCLCCRSNLTSLFHHSLYSYTQTQSTINILMSKC